LRRLGETSAGFQIVGQGLGGGCNRPAQAGPFRVEPVLKLRCRAGHVEPVKEGSSIELENHAHVSARQRTIYGRGITPEHFFGHGNLFVTSSSDDLWPQLGPQKVE
jgi:hypothetical protein